VRFPAPPHAGRTVLEVEGLGKSYGSLEVFRDVAFDVGRGERLLIMGLNGAGKTSLLRVLAGVTDADAGRVRFGHEVTPGYYAQEHEGIEAGPHAARAPRRRDAARPRAAAAVDPRHVRADR
jgi:ATPase subunit of ABC transporter with duplicated ATPase domains